MTAPDLGDDGQLLGALREALEGGGTLAVRHTNPELATWRGHIAPCRHGNLRGRYYDQVGGHRYAYVIWTEGDGADGKPPKAGWYGTEALTRDMPAALAAIDADYPGWHAWLSDAGRAYASRALKPSTHNGCGECLDADTTAGLRELLKEATA